MQPPPPFIFVSSLSLSVHCAMYLHCHKNIKNVHKKYKTFSCTAVGCNGICLAFVSILRETATVASAPTVRGSVFARRFRLFLRQCILSYIPPTVT